MNTIHIRYDKRHISMAQQNYRHKLDNAIEYEFLEKDVSKRCSYIFFKVMVHHRYVVMLFSAAKLSKLN